MHMRTSAARTSDCSVKNLSAVMYGAVLRAVISEYLCGGLA